MGAVALCDEVGLDIAEHVFLNMDKAFGSRIGVTSNIYALLKEIKTEGWLGELI